MMVHTWDFNYLEGGGRGIDIQGLGNIDPSKIKIKVKVL